jgi:hypothetical protein
MLGDVALTWVGPNSVQCVCSSHFAANDFLNKGQCDMNLCKRLLLVKIAVPSDVVAISTASSCNSVPVVRSERSTQCNFYAEQFYERTRTVSCQTTFSFGKFVYNMRTLWTRVIPVSSKHSCMSTISAFSQDSMGSAVE